MKFICSFPKCGRTWLRYTLAQYCQLLYGTDVPVGFGQLGKVFIDHGGPKRERIYDKFPLVKFAHDLPFQQALGKKRVILIRNFLDTMVSYHHHLSLSDNSGLSMMENIRNNLMMKWVEYMKAWIHADGANQWARYEDMKKVSAWQNLLHYLDIEQDNAKIMKAMERSSFDNMLADEKKNPISQSNDQNHRRVRKGKVSGWKDEIGLSAGEGLMRDTRKKFDNKELIILDGLEVFNL